MMLLKKTIIAFLSASFCLPTLAAKDSSFSELDQVTKKAKQPQSQKNQEIIAYVNQRLDEYEQWREEYTKDLDEKRLALIEQWGSAEVSDQTVDVEYSVDNRVRKVIDYDTNIATVSVLVDSSLQMDEAKKLLEKQIQLPNGEILNTKQAQLFQDEIDYSLQQEEKAKAFVLKQTQLQMNEIDVQAERLISANTNIPDELIYQRAHSKKIALIKEAKPRMQTISQLYASKRQELNTRLSLVDKQKVENSERRSHVVNAQRHHTETKQAKVNNEKKTEEPISAVTQVLAPEKKEAESHTQIAPLPMKKMVSYKVKLPNNSLAKRAHQYQSLATQESSKWSIAPSLVMAIMHTESAFRPEAKSHVPAFGLMQVVPTSAGRDVNKRIHNIDAPMKEADLYQPDFNVETGTAYLHILNSKYLKNIKNEQSRLYCMIAAYNTGAGNVARAFNDNRSTNIREAVDKINRMTSEQVYAQLIDRLPYDETKNYLKKVSSRMDLY